MGIIGGILGVAVLLFIIFFAGTAMQAAIYGKLQKQCAKDPFVFKQAADDEKCWDVDVSAIKHPASEGWSEFIPYPGDGDMSIWLRFNGSRYLDEKEALRALLKRVNSSVKVEAKNKKELQVLSFFETREAPKGFPPVGSKVSYRWFSYKDGVHMDGRASFIVKQIYNENAMLIQENNKKYRAMGFKEFCDLYINPISDCRIELPS